MCKWLSIPALDSDSRIWLSAQRAAVEAYLNGGRWQSWSRNMALHERARRNADENVVRARAWRLPIFRKLFHNSSLSDLHADISEAAMRPLAGIVRMC